MTSKNGTRKVDKNGVVTYSGYKASSQVRKAAADALGGFADPKASTSKKRKK
jgi:hypothetical protein